MQDAKRFVQLGADDQLRVLRLMQALADKDTAKAAWAWLVCRISADAEEPARTVTLLYVEEGLQWKQVAKQTGYSVRYCYILYKQAMEQVNGRK